MKLVSNLGCFYAVNLAYFYLHLLPSLARAISKKCHETPSCARYLQLTWLNYYTDRADGQWREFRGSLWLLWACLLLSLSMNFIIRGLWKHFSAGTSRKQDGGLFLQNLFRLLFGAIFLAVQHGYHALIVVAIALVGYSLTKFMKDSRFNVLTTWTYAVTILLLKESYRVQYQAPFRMLQPLFARSYGGMYSWYLAANFLILRLISFQLDHGRACAYHHHKNAAHVVVEVAVKEFAAASLTSGVQRSIKDEDKENDTVGGQGHDVASEPLLSHANRNDSKGGGEKKGGSRVNRVPIELVEFNLFNFAVYIFYAPLYMAGPIITFSDFVSSGRANMNASIFSWMYCCRWVLCFALMEFLTDKLPLFAVLSSGLLFQLEVSEVAGAAYMMLKLMWLKFLLVWRFFRLWGLADGIEAPENMLRCMSNNYSLEQFWKGWHSSFNKWIVTYLYLPLGGRERPVFSVFIVFFFVAVWHDIEWKLLVWGALNSVFFVLEMIAKRTLKSRLMTELPPILSHLVCCLCGAVYIMILVAVNLIGYAVGVSGIANIYDKVVTWEGLRVIMVFLYFGAVGTSIMISLENWKQQVVVSDPLNVTKDSDSATKDSNVLCPLKGRTQ